MQLTLRRESSGPDLRRPIRHKPVERPLNEDDQVRVFSAQVVPSRPAPWADGIENSERRSTFGVSGFRKPSRRMQFHTAWIPVRQGTLPATRSQTWLG